MAGSMADARSGDASRAQRKQSGILLAVEPLGPRSVMLDVVTHSAPDLFGSVKDHRFSFEATLETEAEREKWLVAATTLGLRHVKLNFGSGGAAGALRGEWSGASIAAPVTVVASAPPPPPASSAQPGPSIVITAAAPGIEPTATLPPMIWPTLDVPTAAPPVAPACTCGGEPTSAPAAPSVAATSFAAASFGDGSGMGTTAQQDQASSSGQAASSSSQAAPSSAGSGVSDMFADAKAAVTQAKEAADAARTVNRVAGEAPNEK